MTFQLDSNEYSDFKVSYKHSQIAEINMTPFVDVCLVLLIIFMITAPFAISGVNVKLPKSQSKNLSLNQNSLVLTIDKNGHYYLGKNQILEKNLFFKLSDAKTSKSELNSDSSIFIRADKDVLYSRVMFAVTAANKAGILKIGLLGDANK